MRLPLLVSIFSFFITASSAFAGDEIISVHQAASLLTKHCAGCHQTEKHPGALFLSEAKLSTEETMKFLIRLLETGQMPLNSHKRFAKSEDGKKLLRWLKSESGHKKN